VDAIVRPQLLTHNPHQDSYLKSSVVCMQQKKFWRNFGDGGVGPPLLTQFQCYPPPPLSGRVLGQGGADENHSHLELSQGAGNRATAGAHTLSHSPNSTGKRKTQRKALQILGVWCLTRLCNKCIKLQIVGVCLVRCCVVCACYRLNPAIKM
jgi:hypothetical protein